LLTGNAIRNFFLPVRLMFI